MSGRFRLPCKMALYIGEGRPQKPNWMLEENKPNATRNQKRSFSYWSHIWQCTPGWADQGFVSEMREIYLSAPDDYEVDHIVPLNSNIVCGLHVPCNLQALPKLENQHKSNNHWPGMPYEQLDLFK